MKNLLILLLFFCNFIVAQEHHVEFVQKIPLESDSYCGTDTFGSFYFIKDNVFYKKQGFQLFQYADFQLGKIENVDVLNPLQIVLFYKNSNSIVILDNKLTEIRKFNFNDSEPLKTVGFVGVAGGNNLWIFNVDEQRLEIFPAKPNRRQNIPQTKPIEGEIIGFANNYNFCWVFTEEKLLQFNLYGVLVSALPIEGIEALAQDNGNLVFFKNEKLYYLGKDSVTPVAFKLPEIEIDNFYLNNEILYIYSNQFVHQYKLIQPKK